MNNIIHVHLASNLWVTCKLLHVTELAGYTQIIVHVPNRPLSQLSSAFQNKSWAQENN